MRRENNAPAARGQQTCAVDYLEALLRKGRAPIFDKLLALAPDEPLAELEEFEGLKMAQVRNIGWTAVPRKLTKADFALRERFPGYQASHRFRENMKYGDVPADEAPLSEWVAKMIDHAKAKWSGEIDGPQTRLQFKEWLPYYLDNDRLCWTGHPKLERARELLRIACGMSRFAPTRRSCQ